MAFRRQRQCRWPASGDFAIASDAIHYREQRPQRRQLVGPSALAVPAVAERTTWFVRVSRDLVILMKTRLIEPVLEAGSYCWLIDMGGRLVGVHSKAGGACGSTTT